MSSVYVVCWIFLQTFQTYFCILANSVDPDQTAPSLICVHTICKNEGVDRGVGIPHFPPHYPHFPSLFPPLSSPIYPTSLPPYPHFPPLSKLFPPLNQNFLISPTL